MFKLRPPKTRYTETWDNQPLLQKPSSIYPLHTLTLKEITLKLVMLMALTEAARIHYLHILTLSDIDCEKHFTPLQLGGNFTQCRPRFNIHSYISGLHNDATQSVARLCELPSLGVRSLDSVLPWL